MKAKVKETGEIIELKCPTFLEAINGRFTENDTGKVYTSSEIEFIKEKEDNIDWQQVRIQAAISAMQNLCGCERFWSYPEEDIAKYSVRYADALIKELKKEK